ncbi:MAG: quinol:cytochrome C oxidoreductase [Flavobacteriaceae bacterium]|nr:quinol:cytochrome C oxidoreductase [Flavobacteriaceae bacterium]MCY4266280.1 quinol:cytochrome C oxidoreductase [Flavobacteriaceae bacterium]MCY4299512.1 quinol:cytochrome C oxidoreductase [Flavobacteriaceae bacterium]
MDYRFSKHLKRGSIICILIGAIAIAYGFWTTPKTVEQAQKKVASSHHHGHGSTSHDDQIHVDQNHSDDDSYQHATDKEKHDKHGEHVLHQFQNKPWAAVYVSALFFFFIALGALAFYAVQRASQAGWPIVLYRVMESISAYVIPGGMIVFLILLFSVLGANHMFVWTDPKVVAYDVIIQNKSWYLNINGFIVRSLVILLGWGLYRTLVRRFSLKQDEDTALAVNYHKKNFKLSAGFLVFYILSVSVMSWDWLMSIDPHWFSTLFGWYVFASMFVSGITVIAMTTIYLKSKGYLDFVNSSHIHDLAKFMFGISIFWTYLWFSQYMLIWYSNIPEEVTYFISRFEDYQLPFLSLLVFNFLFPVLILMNTDFKRTNYIVIVTGIIIVIGHYLDVFHMVMPGTVGDQWSLGFVEIGAFVFFFGLFILIVFRSLEKAPLLAQNDPFIEESKRFHY